MAGGVAGGTRIVPADWITRCLTCAVAMPDGGCYDRHWFAGRTTVGSGGAARPIDWHLANGNGGQRLMLLPTLQALLVMTAGNYNKPGQDRPSAAILREVVLPELHG